MLSGKRASLAKKKGDNRLHVFVSHNFSDFGVVKKLVADLAAQGIIIYAFEHDAKPGSLIADKVRDAIHRSHAVVALLTASGAGSVWVQQEIGAAKQAGKLIVPLVENSVDLARLGMLTGIEALRFDETDLDSLKRRLEAFLYERRSAFLLEQQQQALNALLAIGAGLLLLYAAANAK